jgi:hypothetical protein
MFFTKIMFATPKQMLRRPLQMDIPANKDLVCFTDYTKINNQCTEYHEKVIIF